MIELVLNTMPTITNPYELIDILYHLPHFDSKGITDLHHSYQNHTNSCNPTQPLELSTDEVIMKFRDKDA